MPANTRNRPWLQGFRWFRQSGSNPGSGTDGMPANEAETAGSLVQSRTNPAKVGRRRVVARPIPDAPGTVWHRWDDRAVAEPTECEIAFGAGCELEAVAA
jgi:hypothetical protein